MIIRKKRDKNWKWTRLNGLYHGKYVDTDIVTDYNKFGVVVGLSRTVDNELNKVKAQIEYFL